MNTKFNPETDIIFTIDQKLRGKPIERNKPLPVTSDPSSPPKTLPEIPTPSPVVPETLNVPQDQTLVFFEYQVPIFAQWCQQNANALRRPYQVITDLSVLTAELKKKIPIALFLPFSVAPKAMEQLVGQISTKFHHVKLVLIALEPWPMEKTKELQTKYQSSGRIIHFAVWPMGALSIEEILKSA